MLVGVEVAVENLQLFILRQRCVPCVGVVIGCERTLEGVCVRWVMLVLILQSECSALRLAHMLSALSHSRCVTHSVAALPHPAFTPQSAVPGTWTRPGPCMAPASGSRASRPGIASPRRAPHRPRAAWPGLRVARRRDSEVTVAVTAGTHGQGAVNRVRRNR